MKVIGLLGGMSWESSVHYYRIINEEVRRRRGGLHSARCLLLSVDFAEIARMQAEARWEEAGEVLATAAAELERGGAELLVLCTNTMHKVAPAIEARARVPLLHIADPTAEAVQQAGLRRVGLLATGFTMAQDFYIGRLRERHGLEVILPGEDDRALVHRVIYDELCVGRVEEASRRRVVAIIEELVGRGAEGLILGCTELMLLIRPEDVAVPLFDTTALHAKAAVDRALADPPR